MYSFDSGNDESSAVSPNMMFSSSSAARTVMPLLKIIEVIITIMINNDIFALSVLFAIGAPFVSDNWIGILLKTISYIYRRIWWIYEEFGVFMCW